MFIIFVNLFYHRDITFLIHLIKLDSLAVIVGSYFTLQAHVTSPFKSNATLCGFALLAGLTASSNT